MFTQTSSNDIIQYVRNSLSLETRKNISDSLKLAWKERRYKFSTGEKHAEAVSKGTKGRYRADVKTIHELSSRTIRKVLKRLNLPCSLCSWNLGVCDLHHINGKNGSRSNSHENLTYICPNCHRLVHNGMIEKEKLIPISKYFPKNWREKYYG